MPKAWSFWQNSAELGLLRRNLTAKVQGHFSTMKRHEKLGQEPASSRYRVFRYGPSSAFCPSREVFDKSAEACKTGVNGSYIRPIFCEFRAVEPLRKQRQILFLRYPQVHIPAIKQSEHQLIIRLVRL
jgi:hypothetical protein